MYRGATIKYIGGCKEQQGLSHGGAVVSNFVVCTSKISYVYDIGLYLLYGKYMVNTGCCFKESRFLKKVQLGR